MKKQLQEFRIDLPSNWLSLVLLCFTVLSGFQSAALAEGSKDFVNYPGYRLFLDTRDDQQFKVYANAGEFINVGSSHVGKAGGFIVIINPIGEIIAVFDGTDPDATLAIIYDNFQEENGPVGFAEGGYEPGVVEVPAGQEGIWTVVFDYPTYQNTFFPNIPNGFPWSRDFNQPNSQRVVLAWDITVSVGAPGNQGGELLEGRVYTNEYGTLINGNNDKTSAIFYVLTKDGFIYQVNANDFAPFRFYFFSNSLGLVDGGGNPSRQSAYRDQILENGDTSTWEPGQIYLYPPQAKDIGALVSNKLFFNIPNPDLPGTATVTDIFSNETYTTWLRKTAEVFSLKTPYLAGLSTQDYLCAPGTMEFSGGAYLILETNLGGVASLQLDLNNNGLFDDPEDVEVNGNINEGIDQLFWDGNDGLGNPVFIQDGFTFGYRGSILFGECHFAMVDIEICEGGVTFEWLNPFDGAQPNLFYYDHSAVEGPISGGLTYGDPLPTSTPFTYSDNFGNDKYLDNWTQIEFQIPEGTITVDVEDTCSDASSFFETDENSISLMPFADGLEGPLDLAHCGDERLFVAEKKRKDLGARCRWQQA